MKGEQVFDSAKAAVPVRLIGAEGVQPASPARDRWLGKQGDPAVPRKWVQGLLGMVASTFRDPATRQACPQGLRLGPAPFR